MKKHTLLFISLFILGFKAIGQDKINLVIFSEDGDAFYAFLNGVKQNVNPETNVKVVGVSPNISLRIEFENKALPQLKQASPMEPGFEHTLRIKKDSKGQLKLRYFGQTPLGSESSSGATAIQYHSSDSPADDNSQTTTGNSSPNTVVSSTTTTTKTTRGNPQGDNVSVNINVGGMGMNMSVNENMASDMHTTSSTTVTSTSSSNYSGNSTSVSNSGNGGAAITPAKAGCSSAMSSANFSKMKQSVADKPFSETKMSTAKVATKNACVSVNQVKEICNLFSMDDDKLTYAKFAYDYCVDKANYYQVSEVFSFAATTEDFNKFLEQ